MPSNQISHRTFLLRLRKLAQKALEAYGLEDAKLRFYTYTGNGIYKVIVPSDSRLKNLFAPGQHTLRLHQPNYMKPDYISSELEWLSALSNAGIEVPEPFRNLNGDWLTKVDSEYEIPCKRNCTLLRWIEGRLVKKNPRPHHFSALGRVIGRMHEQSIHWKIRKGFTRPHWDWEGLFGDGINYGVPAKDARDAIPKTHQRAFNDALAQVKEVFEQLGKGKNVYGLIHADLGVNSNLVFHAGKACPLDFDDCGFGYWLFDLGVVLACYFSDFNDPTPTMQNALIKGYEEMTPLSDMNMEYLDLFIAARYAQLMFFYQGVAIHHPRHRDEAVQEVNHYGKHLKRILKKI
ncbi:MAG: phosphotransferase [Theionarchaea archaeon]|nr:MAG: hypothetical protein AYK18_00740 [Theionarchaea archaeon DG-70]MBU7012445.1 phosphotransferase [Theionarchaea archaeon]